jgi:ribosomal protein S18 acetylase RimI-like enzyme
MCAAIQTGTHSGRDGLLWRSATAADADPIAAAIEGWWARHLRHFVHPLFLEHFGDTCLVVEDEGKLVAFLVGMLSQRHAGQAYVHFMGVHPDCRGLGLGREL